MADYMRDGLTAGQAPTSLHRYNCTYAAGTLEALVTALADNHTLSSFDIHSNLFNSPAQAKTLHEGLRLNRSLVSLELGLDCKGRPESPYVSISLTEIPLVSHDCIPAKAQQPPAEPHPGIR
jgi:hypothetical protein